MKKIYICIFCAVLLSGCINQLEQEFLAQDMVIPVEHANFALSEYSKPLDFSGYERADEIGVDWWCSQSSFSVSGHIVQIPTKYDEFHVCACKGKVAMCMYCPNGVKENQEGIPDECIK